MMTDADNIAKILERLPELSRFIPEYQTSDQEKTATSAVIEAITPVLNAIFFGEDPNIEAVDRVQLKSSPELAANIASVMAESSQSDVKRAGLLLLGMLDDPKQLPILLSAAESKTDWVRLSAIDALALVRAEWSRSPLERLAGHPDPVTSHRALEALKSHQPSDNGVRG